MIGDVVTSGVERILDVSAASVYSEPVRVGDRVIVPAAAIDRVGGFGYGHDAEPAGGGRPDGGGGGSSSRGRPVAVIEVRAEGVVVRPVLHLTKIGITLVAAALTVWKATRR